MLKLLLPNDDLREQVYDYIPLLLAEYQSSLEALFITQVPDVSNMGLSCIWKGPLCRQFTPVQCLVGKT